MNFISQRIQHRDCAMRFVKFCMTNTSRLTLYGTKLTAMPEALGFFADRRHVLRTSVPLVRINKEFVSIYGAGRLDRHDADHPYPDSTDNPDRDSDHPGRDE